jgi:phage repressor protein C with HTH and peptisase S24 domain
MNDAERIDKFLKHVKKSKNSAGISIGDKNGMRFNHVISGRNEISEKLARDITKAYPEINYLWILEGKGEMINYDLKESKIETLEEPATNYYYPDVNASAGLETEMQNDELKRIPINIPNWEKGVAFINVYGDSMYPKYCSGEIIGIKEVEPQYINYGYAYVVIFNDGQVFLKYIRKGKDNEHWLLDSENSKYESREYHLSLIKKVFIIKGVITKTTM